MKPIYLKKFEPADIAKDLVLVHTTMKFVGIFLSLSLSHTTNEVLFSICLHRISGLQLMIAEPFFYPFKAYWEVWSELRACLN